MSKKLRARLSWSTPSRPAACIQMLSRIGLTRGVSRLAAFAGGRIPVRFGSITLEMNLVVPNERHLFLGLGERDVLAVFEQFLRPGDVAVDVGANIGFHTSFMADLVGPNGRVYAFEPNPSLHPRLKRLTENNPLGNIELIEYAASDVDDKALLYLSSISGLSSLNNNWSPKTALGRQEVQTITLDRFLASTGSQRTRLIKIDVEGHERAVFRGLSETLRRNSVDVFVFEITPPDHSTYDADGVIEILDTLARNGYASFGLSEHNYLPRNEFMTDLTLLAPGYNLVAMSMTM